MSIVSQARRFAQTMRYQSLEAPRLTDALAVPVPQDEVARISNGLTTGTLQPSGTAERLALMAPEDELVRGEVQNSPKRAAVFAAAAIRTAREVDGGFLPDDPKTVLNRMMIDVAYSRAASNELEYRKGTLRSNGSPSISGDLMGPSAGDGPKSLKDLTEPVLSRMATGHLDQASQGVRRAMSNDALQLTASGSFSDRWEKRPVAERRLEAPVLLAAVRAAREGAGR